MNLKLELSKACIFILIGAFLFSHFKKDPKPLDLPAVAQNQSQACKAVSTKVTDKNGKVTESVSFEAVSNQEQKISVSQKPEFNHSAILLQDQLSYSYKYIKNDMFELSPLVQVRKDKSFHGGIQINF